MVCPHHPLIGKALISCIAGLVFTQFQPSCFHHGLLPPNSHCCYFISSAWCIPFLDLALHWLMFSYITLYHMLLFHRVDCKYITLCWYIWVINSNLNYLRWTISEAEVWHRCICWSNLAFPTMTRHTGSKTGYIRQYWYHRHELT